jgi:hypothetical protein
MKVEYLSAIVLIIFLVWLGLTNFPLYKEKVRPIKVQVLDGLNDEPLKNVIVYYNVKTVRVKNLLGIPIIDPLEYRDVVRKKLFTDNNGCIDLPQQKVYLKLYEEVLREYICLNLDLKEKSKRMEDFFESPRGSILNPIKYLKGAIIESSKIELNPNEYNLNSENENSKRIFNGESLLKESDQLIIRLERYND